MRSIEDAAIRRNRYPIANGNTRLAHDVDILLDAHIAADPQLRSAMRKGGYCLKARPLPDGNTISQKDVSRIVEKEGAANQTTLSYPSKDPSVINHRPEPDQGRGKLLKLAVQRPPQEGSNSLREMHPIDSSDLALNSTVRRSAPHAGHS
jgi:hypothetical protein